VLLDRSGSADSSPYAGHLNSLESSLRERFSEQATWSASRLEGYATCPFFFFAGSALGLEIIRPPKAGFETPQLGSLLHEALERLYRDCPAPRTVEALLARLTDVAVQVFADAPAKYSFRPTLLWDIQQAELLAEEWAEEEPVYDKM
jgi:ATP-dependent helicase/DNAse subunit B